MNQKAVSLVIVVVMIVLGILYLESTAVKPSYSKEIDMKANQSLTKKVNGADYPLAPELRDIAGYINADEGIKISDYRGKVVLIDFWTYSCINCIRTLPYLKEWHKKYKDNGLVIIGVHTPEFDFEKKYDNVKMATEKYGVEYKVVLDNDYSTWTAFGNRFWPRKYLIDAEGYIRYDHIGEGGYAVTEKNIQELLKEINQSVSDMGIIEVKAEQPGLLITPELYVGYEFALPRSQDIGNDKGLQPDKIVNYILPDQLDNDVIYLKGEWLSNKDNLRSQAKELSSIILKFDASSANIVAGTESAPLRVDVFIDGEYVKPEQAGSDVKFEGGKAFILVDGPRLYNVVNAKRGRYTLELSTSSTDFTFNAFTFG